MALRSQQWAGLPSLRPPGRRARHRPLATIERVEFRRIANLPPYVFKVIDELKIDARRRGVDIIDLGFGNPDIPSPEIAVEKLAEAARLPRNHR